LIIEDIDLGKSSANNLTTNSNLTAQGFKFSNTSKAGLVFSTAGVLDTVAGITFASNTLTVSEDVRIHGNLAVDGTLTVINTENLVVTDPIIELGNNATLTTDTGIIYTRPTGVSNVMAGWRANDGSNQFVVAFTKSSAFDTVMVPDTSNAISMKVYGNVVATGGFFGDGGFLSNISGLASNLTLDEVVAYGNTTSNLAIFNAGIFSHTVDSDSVTSNTVNTTTLNVTHVQSTDITVDTDIYTSNITADLVTSISVVATGGFFGDGGFLSNISSVPTSSNLNTIVTNGNATSGTVLFQNAGTSLVASGDIKTAKLNKLEIYGSRGGSIGSIAIGSNAGVSNQGSYAIAIGDLAGGTSQANNSIVLNASGATQGASASGFYVNPIRYVAGGTSNVLGYNTATHEVYDTGLAPDGAPTLEQVIAFGNSTSNVAFFNAGIVAVNVDSDRVTSNIVNTTTLNVTHVQATDITVDTDIYTSNITADLATVSVLSFVAGGFASTGGVLRAYVSGTTLHVDATDVLIGSNAVATVVGSPIIDTFNFTGLIDDASLTIAIASSVAFVAYPVGARIKHVDEDPHTNNLLIINKVTGDSLPYVTVTAGYHTD
jgi:hypothetical protein